MIYWLTCIDQHGARPQETPSPIRPGNGTGQASETLYHYVILRKDLPPGVRLAQTIHAAGESALRPLPEGTYAVALDVVDEAELRRRSDRLRAAGVPHVLVTETDAPYHGQAMSIGCVPTSDRDRIRRVTSDLPLAGKAV